MKFLVDNQLPAALARLLTGQGHEARHVWELGLDETPDVKIWEQVIRDGYIMVSKDEDFFHLANRSNAGRLIWVRRPNCRKQLLLAAFQQALPTIEDALEAGQRIIQLK